MPQFLHPFLLWGALAAAVPVVIHLIHRRRFRRQRWAAMDWLLEAVKQNQRRLQMENLLLLVVRTLAVLLLALAIARPTFSDIPLLLGQSRQTHLYVVLDNSGSTAARSGTRSAFDESLAAVSSLVAGLGDDDPVSLALTNDNYDAARRSGRPRMILRNITDHSTVRRRLGDLKPAPARADLVAALKLVEEAVPATDTMLRKVAIVTDLQESSFPETAEHGADDPFRQALARLREKGAEVVLVPVGREVANVAVTGLRTTDDRDVVQGSTAVFQAEVRNYSDRPQRIEVRFTLDGREMGNDASQWVSLPARTAGPDAPPAGSAQYYASFRQDDVGVHVLEATIRDDALHFDDTRALAFRVRPRIQILAVDPDLNVTADGARPETYWLKPALAPEPGGPFEVTQVSEADFHGMRDEDLGRHDVVILANVERPAPDDDARKRLEAFVAQGGALFLTVGDHVVAQRWNEEIFRRSSAANGLGNGLLPARLGTSRFDKDAVIRLDLRGAKHALLRNITDPEFAVFFGSPVLHGFTSLEGLEGDKDARVVLSYDDLAASPALVEKRFGRGRVLLYTSTIDLGWGELPGSYVFPALLHEAAYWLTSRGDAERNLAAFQPWTRSVPANFAKMEVTCPDGSPLPAEAAGLAQQSSVTFLDTSQLGVYRAVLQFKPKDLLGGAAPPENDAFVVNLTPLESDLRRRTPEEISTRYKDLLRTGNESAQEKRQEEARRGEIAMPLIATALLCLLAEVWLVQRIGRRRRR